MTQAPPTPLSKLRKPRQFSQPELDDLFPIDCTIIPATREVRVNPKWERDNLVRVSYPATFGFQSPFKMHRLAAEQFKRWFALIAAAKLHTRIISHNGSYNPRLKRGLGVPTNKYGLSRHARGLALDINASCNPMGRKPAALGEPGCVLELVPLANECGIVAGADWVGAMSDAMHFELGTFDE